MQYKKSMYLYIKITSFEAKCIEGISTVNLEQNKHFSLTRGLEICAACEKVCSVFAAVILSVVILDVKGKCIFSLQVILFFWFFFMPYDCILQSSD